MAASMKCHECHEIARCKPVTMRGEGDKPTLVYLCPACLREWRQDKEN